MFHVKPSIAALNLLAESAPARRLDPDALARRDPKVRLARELSSLSACTHEIVDTPCAGAAARQPPRRDRPPFRQQAHVRLDEALELANQSIAAIEFAASARPVPYPILGDAHRIVRLQRLNRRVERVGHMGMNAGGSRHPRRRPRAACDRLIVGEMTIAKLVVAADR